MHFVPKDFDLAILFIDQGVDAAAYTAIGLLVRIVA
jgi:hypothetical protein